ncbi:hypothetical protein RIF29_04982 [Crotalaria pallida]|uniref:Uncharacterized protein n=1 Tax=Crotalaria pallida TaxID=3830 RepID=A0AAN9PAP3_CROPI
MDKAAVTKGRKSQPNPSHSLSLVLVTRCTSSPSTALTNADPEVHVEIMMLNFLYMVVIFNDAYCHIKEINIPKGILFVELWFWLSSTTTMATDLQSIGMLSREQLFQLFHRFTFLTSQPDVKKRISDAVEDNQEAVAVTTAIQEEILLEMGVDPGFGISCLGKVSTVYENDRDLVIEFYKFLAKEEMACDEAELGKEAFMEKMLIQEKLQEQQLEMLKHMRKFHLDDQCAILEKLHQQMENGNYESETSILSAEQIEENVQRKVSPVFMPR